MNRFRHFPSNVIRDLASSLYLVAIIQAVTLSVFAQTTVTSNPTNQATGVSPSAPVVFTFSGPMNTAATFAQFYSTNPAAFYTVNSAWNAAHDTLTCTPPSPFGANAIINWVVSGLDANNMQVVGQGIFTTGSGSGGGTTGYGTNNVSSFTAGKVYLYSQGPTGPPVPSSPIPYIFNGTAVLASNRTATSITLTLPNAAVSNLLQNPIVKENYSVIYYNTNSNALESTFPPGTYTFTINAATSNQSVAVTLPADQPNAPQITNYVAAQAVDSSKPFTLDWTPFVGGTSSDYILVTIGNWTSGQFGATNALDGTATSVTIPAGALVANSNYTASVGFEHATFATNSTYGSGAFLVTLTTFSLKTIGTSSPPPVVGNPVWNGTSFDFDIDTVLGQTLTVVYSTNCSLPLAQWSKLLTTNSPGAQVHISDSGSPNAPSIFYGVRNGP